MLVRDLLAWNVKKMRVLRGMSQEQLSHEAGLERVAVSQIERKKINAGIDSIGQLADALAIPVADLFVQPQPGEKPPRNLKRGRPSAT